MSSVEDEQLSTETENTKSKLNPMGKNNETDEDIEEDEEEEEEEDDDDKKEESLIIEGKREKKKVERLAFQMTMPVREPLSVEEGKGQKLGEIEWIYILISKTKTDDLRPLHKLLFNRPGTAANVKRNIRLFSGFPFEEGSDQYKKKHEVLKKYKNAILRTICGVLGLEKSGKHEEIVVRILNFLMEPKDLKKSLPKSMKRHQKGEKRKSTSAGSAKKSKSKGKRSAEILIDESSSEDEDKSKKRSSGESEEEEVKEPPKKKVKKEKVQPKGKKQNTKPSNVKKADSSTTKKGQSNNKQESESDSSDDEPLIKMLKIPPSDDDLRTTVKILLEDVNLEEVTMKQVCKKVYEKYPDHNLTNRKEFIKKTVKELIS
ncbi:protein DEK [Erpetoichthys calabaricus]|uniref:Protein DEK n=1 Tax=Erpetoichthys calabaricus TaxID=27687 RepID=A0A8C4TLI7_ERPCA|nr:protein DEK [Erpetoichthys calabaricus]XP_028673390.1 protein DEK [Erpetoichthys calabaricus]XP_028673391.1 protein DEK [Erpetoichthys calabaricus]